MLKVVSSGRSSMCSGKSVGPKMEPQGTPALLDILMKTFHAEAPQTVY